MFKHKRIMYKDYWQIPFGLGEVQYGRLTGRVVIWWRGRRITPSFLQINLIIFLVALPFGYLLTRILF